MQIFNGSMDVGWGIITTDTKVMDMEGTQGLITEMIIQDDKCIFINYTFQMTVF